MSDELRFHIQEFTDDLVRSGSPRTAGGAAGAHRIRRPRRRRGGMPRSPWTAPCRRTAPAIAACRTAATQIAPVHRDGPADPRRMPRREPHDLRGDRCDPAPPAAVSRIRPPRHGVQQLSQSGRRSRRLVDHQLLRTSRTHPRFLCHCHLSLRYGDSRRSRRYRTRTGRAGVAGLLLHSGLRPGHRSQFLGRGDHLRNGQGRHPHGCLLAAAPQCRFECGGQADPCGWNPPYRDRRPAARIPISLIRGPPVLSVHIAARRSRPQATALRRELQASDCPSQAGRDHPAGAGPD